MIMQEDTSLTQLATDIELASPLLTPSRCRLPPPPHGHHMSLILQVQGCSSVVLDCAANPFARQYLNPDDPFADGAVTCPPVSARPPSAAPGAAAATGPVVFGASPPPPSPPPAPPPPPPALRVFFGPACQLWRPANSLRCYWNAPQQSFRGAGCADTRHAACLSAHLTTFIAVSAPAAPLGAVSTAALPTADTGLAQVTRLMWLLLSVVGAISGGMLLGTLIVWAREQNGKRAFFRSIRTPQYGFRPRFADPAAAGAADPAAAAWTWQLTQDALMDDLDIVSGSAVEMAKLLGIPFGRLRAAARAPFFSPPPPSNNVCSLLSRRSRWLCVTRSIYSLQQQFVPLISHLSSLSFQSSFQSPPFRSRRSGSAAACPRPSGAARASRRISSSATPRRCSCARRCSRGRTASGGRCVLFLRRCSAAGGPVRPGGSPRTTCIPAVSTLSSNLPPQAARIPDMQLGNNPRGQNLEQVASSMRGLQRMASIRNGGGPAGGGRGVRGGPPALGEMRAMSVRNFGVRVGSGEGVSQGGYGNGYGGGGGGGGPPEATTETLLGTALVFAFVEEAGLIPLTEARCSSS